MGIFISASFFSLYHSSCGFLANENYTLTDRYLRQHETELLLHDGAENMLKRFGIDVKTLDVEKLRSDYNALYSKKQALQQTYKSAEKEAADLGRKLDKLNRYLDRSPEQVTAAKKAEKKPNTL